MIAAPDLRRLALAVVVLLLTALPVRAEDRPDLLDPADLLARLDAARAAKDVRGVEALVRAAAAAHNRSRSAVVRGRLRARLGEILRDPQEDANRLHAADALAQVDDARAAWRELRRMLPDAAAPQVEPVGLRVLRALGLLAHDPCLDEILRFARASPDPTATSAAVEALGRFRFARQRKAILLDLLALGQEVSERPRRGTEGPPDEVRRRWLRVGDDVVRAMDHLTGRRVGSLAAWQQLVDEKRNELDSLFEATPR